MTAHQIACEAKAMDARTTGGNRTAVVKANPDG